MIRDRHPPTTAPEAGSRRERLFEIVFGHETHAGKAFDLALLALIALSVLVTILDSVADLHHAFGHGFLLLEWGFTLIFTAEYLLRLAIVRQPLRYAFSFYGVIDVLAVLPTYLSLLIPGTQSLLVVRILRVLRIFRILKLTQYVSETSHMFTAIRRSWRKIFVFLFSMLTIVVVFGALMYVIEGPENGFTSIPTAMYWAIVTVATVGFGDIAPHTTAGRMVTSMLILIGYGIIAVPTGIYTAELAVGMRKASTRRCPHCGHRDHLPDARFCQQCGGSLPE